jgi:8-amino-3,8-dideoxy-alpha-D-manno-octulosonate transaminase
MRDDLHVSGTFVGITGRMSELQGAVASVQLNKLGTVLADMRANFWSIRDRVSDLAAEKGVTWRRQWDKNGDASLALIFYLPDETQAQRVVGALRAEGLPAQVMFDPQRVDLHIAYHWAPLGAGRGWSARTPWTAGEGHPGLDLASCPRTYEQLSRAVHVDVSPELTDQQADQVSLAIQKVFSHLPLV